MTGQINPILLLTAQMQPRENLKVLNTANTLKFKKFRFGSQNALGFDSQMKLKMFHLMPWSPYP